jgi:anti-sigma factor RsiW
MADDAVHELSAAYALDALEPAEARAYEEHLAHCETCQRELAMLSATAGALALAAEPATPTPALRERILATARAERPNVVPLRPRARNYAMRALAVAATAAAVGLGIWNVALHNRLGRTHVEAVVVDRGTLVVTGLGTAPAGKTYEAWVIDRGAAQPAGLFRAG